MVKEYKVGDPATLNIIWLKQTGEVATVTGIPTITIKKYTASTNTWSTEINAVNMTQETTSPDTTESWFYEYTTSGETANFDYKATYNAIVDGLTVYAEEDFRIVDTFATQTDIQELRKGNERIDFTYAAVADVGRKVAIGQLDYMTIYTKANSALDWSAPTSTKILYFWYDSSGRLVSVKEND